MKNERGNLGDYPDDRDNETPENMALHSSHLLAQSDRYVFQQFGNVVRQGGYLLDVVSGNLWRITNTEMELVKTKEECLV